MAASARDYVLKLLSEQSLIDAFVDPRVQQLIAAGDLVPRSRLQIGVNLELAPVGLEQAARALAAALSEAEMPEIEGFPEALAALVAVLEKVDPPAVNKPAADDAEHAHAADEHADEVEEPTARCEVCDEEVDEEQKYASITRWRKVLCKKHHASYDPKKERRAS